MSEQIKAEKRHRDAAADLLDELSILLDHNGIGQVADLIRDGEYDEHEATTAFVRFEHNLPRPDAMREALKKLVAKLDECEPHISNAFMHQFIRGGAYTGPTYEAELKAARQALVSSPAASTEARAPVDEVERVAGTRIAAEDFDRAAIEVDHLQHDLDITNADHIALWLEANQVQMACPEISLGWLAVQIVEAHEAATLRPASTARPDVERIVAWLLEAIRTRVRQRDTSITEKTEAYARGMIQAYQNTLAFIRPTATEASEGEVE